MVEMLDDCFGLCYVCFFTALLRRAVYYIGVYNDAGLVIITFL